MKFSTVFGVSFELGRIPPLTKLVILWASLFFLAPANSSAQITNTQVVNIRIGSATGANTKFNTNALIYNFGITTSGGFDYLMTNMGFQLDRGTGVTQDVFVQVFNGFGGTGSLILTNRLNFTNVGTAFSQVNLLLGTNLVVGPGAYSVRLTTGASGSGADTYQFKLGALQLTTTNGTVLPVLQWVEDTDPNGTATTNLVTTNPILADFMISTNSVNFGNYRVGSTLSTNVTLTNNGFATTNNLTGSLLATATNSNAATVSGVTTNFIQQGQTDPFTVGLVTTNVGTNSGTVTLNYRSATNGTAITTRPTWPTNIGSQTIAVTGVGYRLADDSVSTTNVNLGNFRIVDGPGTGTVTITNTATNDGFSERLGVSNSATTGAATVTNLPGALVAAGGTTNVTVGLNTSNAGTNSGTVTLGFNSSGVGTSGFAATNIGTTNINVVAVGYRLADDAVSTTNVNLGNFRIVNGPGTGTVTITNTATNDGFSERLGVSNSATTGAATVTNLPGALVAAGGTTNVTVGLNTSNAGTNSGTVTLGFNSSGVGTSGFAATNIGTTNINVFAVGYRLASNAVSTTNVNLGNFRIVNGAGTTNVSISNTATADGFSEGLGVSNSATSGATVTNIPDGLIAAGGNTNVTVGLSTANAGTNSGSVTLGFNSSGTGTSGFAATNIGSQVVNVTGVGYRLANDAVSTTNVNLGNFRIVNGAGTGTVTISNTATADGFSEGLGVANNGTSGGATVTNVPGSLIAAGGNSTVTVGLSTADAGTNSGTVTFGFNSSGAGTSGFAATNIGSQVVNVTGVGYRLADDAVSTTNVNLGNFRIVNGAGTGTVTISNTATADGFSEGLGVSNSATSGATVSGIPSGLIAAGGNTNINVGLSTANAGTNSGTVTLGFNSSGSGTSGFAATNIGAQVVNVTGVGYRLANDAVSTTNVNLGNFRIVNGAGTGTVTISNAATADGFSEGLGVANNGTTGSAIVTNIPGSLIAAGGNSTVTVGLSTANAGTNSGTVTFGFDSDGAGTSGFGATNIGSQAVNVVGVGYRLASESVSITNLNLGRFHIGYTTNMGSLSGTVGITNTATGDGFSEGLAVANNGTAGGATVGGIPGSLIAAGANANITLGLGSVSAVGTNTGSVTLGFQSSGTGTSGFAATNIGTQVVNVIAQGYSGQAIWNTDAGGSWNNFDNWDVPGGTPGIDGVLLSTNDQATFGGAISSARTVSLNGQSPVLTLLSFSNASASYIVAQGSGGSISMGTESHQTPVINNAAGNHTVSADITLAYATQADVATNSKLTIGGALNGTQNLQKTGVGTLSITGTGNLSGNTTVTAGTLQVNGSIASSDVTVDSGALLTGSGSVGGIVMNIGGTVNPGNSPGTIYATNVVWNGGANYNWEISDASTNNTPGTTWDLISASGTLDLGALSETNRFNINLWTLSGVSPDVDGPANNFINTQSYRWTILNAAGGIIGGFATNKFNIYLAAINGTGGWANDLGGGSIYVDLQGNNLDLVFNPNVGPEPIPEPGTWAAAALLVAAAGYVRWRRRQTS